VAADEPGISRVPRGADFAYRWPDGRLVRGVARLARIRALAIPPAWTNVWIATDPCGHIQATGRDARGRKQYRYHARFRAAQDTSKFARLATFGRALPRIRRRVRQDMATPGLTRDRVVATVVRLLEVTAMRVGNAEYARTNASFGVTTLRDRHVTVEGARLRFRFKGKGGRMIEAGLRDRRIARIVGRCQALPGQELFQYLDDEGEAHSVGSADVNAYLREAAGAPVSAKDFRTWAGSLLAFRALRDAGEALAAPPRRALRASFELVAEALGNTPTVSRSSYVAPRIVDAFVDGNLGLREAPARPRAVAGTRTEELALIRLLESRARAAAGSRA
jgi:DNA topoisomerase-1